MSSKVKKLKLSTEFQYFLSKNRLDQVKIELEEYDPTSLDILTNPGEHKEPYDCYIDAILYHIKKNYKKQIKMKNISKKIEKESEYFRLMFLGDSNLNTMCLIVDDDPMKTLVMTFCEHIRLGNAVKIVNPHLTGYFNDMPVVKCEGIIPSDFPFTIQKSISVNSNGEEHLMLGRFSTKKFTLKKLCFCETCCKGACDGRYGPYCYCLSKSNFNTPMLGYEFVFDDYPAIRFKPFISCELTSLLVHNDVVASGFDKDDNVNLRSIRIHMCSELSNKEITFFVWCKPSADAENESFTVRKGNICRVIVSDESSIDKYNFPTDEIPTPNQAATNQDAANQSQTNQDDDD